MKNAKEARFVSTEASDTVTKYMIDDVLSQISDAIDRACDDGRFKLKWKVSSVPNHVVLEVIYAMRNNGYSAVCSGDVLEVSW